MKICGIDEAGRGPVIGPLVIAGVSIEESNLETLKKLEPKDSKMLSKKRREELFDQIQAITDYYIVIVEPEQVDAALIAPELNLNKLKTSRLESTKIYTMCTFRISKIKRRRKLHHVIFWLKILNSS